MQFIFLNLMLSFFLVVGCTNKVKIETEKTPKKFIKATCANGLLSDAKCSEAANGTDSETEEETEPSTPESFALTNPSATSIQLSWSEGSDNTETFVVERKLAYTNWTQIASLDSATFSYVDSTPPLGITVSYRIKATNSVGESSYTDLVSGTATFDTTLAFTLTGAEATTRLGQAVASAGDVNNDGKDDVIVGGYDAPSGGTQRGTAVVYSGATGSALHTVNGTEDSAHLGQSVSSAGDVDNDGKDDFIVGEYHADAGGINRGKAYVYSGATGSILYTKTGTEDHGQLGNGVAPAGDINNDGFDDFAIAEPLADLGGTNRGRIYIYSGATGVALRTLSGTVDSDLLGLGVKLAGDINADGVPDLITGAGNAPGGGVQRGQVVVFSGADGSILHSLNGPTDSYHLGYSVAGAGDVNGDGNNDFIAGNGDDEAYVFSGLTGSLLHTFVAGAYFGWSVAGIGDANADGFDDLLVGAQDDDGWGYIYSGATGTLLKTLYGPAGKNGNFGEAVAVAGDINGDGKRDIIIGAPRVNVVGSDEGQAFIYLMP